MEPHLLRLKALTGKVRACFSAFLRPSLKHTVVQPIRAIALAVSHGSPIATVRIRAQVRSCGMCGGQNGTGTGFLRVLRFPVPILIPPTAPHSSSIIRGWYHKPDRGRRTMWTQYHSTPRN
jgi:hypothetical protein